MQALFSYLLLARNRMHSRNVLASLFWVDATEEHARGCLNTSLWRLRQVLEANGTRPGTYLIINHQNEVGFNPASDHWLDVDVLERCIHPVLARPVEKVTNTEAQALEDSLNLYRGDLLEGFYDDWALRERERLRFLYLNGLAFLMRYYQIKNAYEKSLVCGQRILALDPLREEIHRDMIRLYMQNGQRALAIRQYQICCSILTEELNILPMEETQALYNQIATMQNVPAPLANPDRQALSRLLGELEHTQLSISSAELQINHLIKEIQLLMASR
jgi:DNA-binding SARP family transcriptional activator